MGLTSVGSNPSLPNILILKPNIYFITKLNLILSRKKLNTYFIFSTKILNLIKLFYLIGCIFRYKIISLANGKKYIKISLFFYKNKTFFKLIKLVSTPSKLFYISYNSLNIITKSLKSSILILSTSKGLMTHISANKLKIGGLLIFTIS